MKGKGRLGLVGLIVLTLFVGMGWAENNEKIALEKKKQVLIKQLSTEKIPHIKARTIEDLGNLKAKEAVPEIIKCLDKNKDMDVRSQACRALGEIGDKRATSHLIKILEDKEEHWFVQEEAAQALTNFNTPEALSFLTEKRKQLLEELSKEEMPHIKTKIIRKLGNLKAKEAVPEIIKALQDENLKAYACEALGEIGDKRATSHLIKILEDKKGNWRVQETVAKALGKIEGASILDTLMDVLIYECEYERKKVYPSISAVSVWSEDEFIEREYCCIIFEACKEDKENCIPKLNKYLHQAKNGSKLKWYIAWTLGRLGEKEVAPILIEYLEKSKDGRIRDDAARILGDLGDKRAIEPLKKALKDDYIAISKIGDVRKNYGYSVRLAAYCSLKKLGVKVTRKGRSARNFEYFIEK